MLKPVNAQAGLGLRPSLVWLALPACSAVRPPPPPTLVLDGACAGVKRSESWKDKSGKSHWSYRIKVQPWTVFGRVHVELHGWSMQVQDIYSGDVDEKAKSFWVMLHPEHSAGPDSTFQIEGDGEPYANPTLTCEGLHPVGLRPVQSTRRLHRRSNTSTRHPDSMCVSSLHPRCAARGNVCRTVPIETPIRAAVRHA